jgi:hypothetical protein
MKECRICKRNLDESCFPINRTDKKKGKIYYKTICKECKKADTITDHKVINKDTITDHNIMTRLTLVEKEIESLKVAIKGNTITDNKSMANYKFDKATRIKTTYNIERVVKSELDKYCKSELKNNSDIVNLALMQYLKL